MPYRLHKVAAGFLGLLDLKTQGQSPPWVSEQVIPVLPMLDAYGLTRTSSRSNSVAVQNADDIGGQITVPNGSIYRWLGVGVALTVAAADVALTPNVLIQIRRAGVAPTITVQSSILTGYTATNLTKNTGLLLPYPIWLEAGDRFQATLDTALSAAGSLQITALFVEIPA